MERFGLEEMRYFQKIFLASVTDYDVNLLCYVLLPNHFHALVQGSEDQFAQLQAQIKNRFAFYNIWHKRQTSWSQLRETYFYILRNPIAAGLVERAEDYPFSSIPLVLGRKDREFFPADPLHLHLRPQIVLGWINNFERTV